MAHHRSAYGVLATLAAYCLWGLLPIYWKQLSAIPADEIIAHRIIWSCLCMLVVMAVRSTLSGVSRAMKKPGARLGVVMCALLITVNWSVYVWAVNAGHVVDASMGYFINPIVSVLFGTLLLRERIGWEGIVALACAGIGVAILVIGIGRVPWIAIALALTFALYGLLKKTLPVDAETGLFLETAVITPLAIAFLVVLNLFSSRGATAHADAGTLLLLASVGIVTAVPLLLFGIGARMIDLSIVGFLQYVAPTLMLLLGIFVYGEAMPREKLAAFGFIWMGLAIFTSVRIARTTRHGAKRYGAITLITE